MRTFRRLLIALVAFAVVASATPAFAQTDAPRNITSLTMPTFAPPPISAPMTFAPQEMVRRNEQGLGVFLQIGFDRTTTFGANGLPSPGALDNAMRSILIGIGFGGNKSGSFGIGADINYIKKGGSARFFDENGFFVDEGDLDLHYLEVPIIGYFNIGGRRTRNAPTFHILVGGFIDILLKSRLDGFNIKDRFHGFNLGPLFGLGFEVARIGIETRLQWELMTLQSTGTNHNGQPTFLNGLEGAKGFTIIVLFKLRLN